MEAQGYLHKASNNFYPEHNQPNSLHSHISLISILILSCYLRLGLPKGLFPVGKESVPATLAFSRKHCHSRSGNIFTAEDGLPPL